MAMNSELGARKHVLITPALHQALVMVAKLHHTSVSEEMRKAAERHVERYGLVVIDEELTINPLIWPASEIQGGGGNPSGRRIQGGGGMATPPRSTPEDPAYLQE